MSDGKVRGYKIFSIILKYQTILSEWRLGKDDSRSLFRHPRQFLGKSHFESENKSRATFSGKDYPPAVKKLELPDRIMVDYHICLSRIKLIH
jgi:hypothetical protein